MSLFEKKKHIPRSDFRRELGKASPYIPRSGGRMYNQAERTKMEREIFGRKKYGGFISKSEYKDAIKKMKKQRYGMKTLKEKTSLSRKIRFLENLGGF